ncbi:MAG: SDR family oxidoreductase [Ruminococcaceae bacterium]|nr:SDR family oxidoreductase [Oscillospiraceae bacterium]
MKNNKIALVTGSSRGIGRAIAIRLAKDGYKVIVHGAGRIEKAKETAEIIKNNGGEAEVIISDLTDLSKTAELCEKIKNVDVLILNASLQYRTPWQEIPQKECFEQLNCNFISSLMLIQAAVDNMKQNKWGRVVTIGSVQEAKPHPDMLVYSASKAAQTNMVQSLSLQLAKDGITVNNVAPGVIYTDRNVEALSDPEYAKKVTDSIPVGFYGEPQDCEGIVSLLCSDEGRYITGQNIFVDGGKSVQ